MGHLCPGVRSSGVGGDRVNLAASDDDALSRRAPGLSAPVGRPSSLGSMTGERAAAVALQCRLWLLALSVPPIIEGGHRAWQRPRCGTAGSVRRPGVSGDRKLVARNVRDPPGGCPMIRRTTPPRPLLLVPRHRRPC